MYNTQIALNYSFNMGEELDKQSLLRVLRRQIGEYSQLPSSKRLNSPFRIFTLVFSPIHSPFYCCLYFFCVLRWIVNCRALAPCCSMTIDYSHLFTVFPFIQFCICDSFTIMRSFANLFALFKNKYFIPLSLQ